MPPLWRRSEEGSSRCSTHVTQFFECLKSVHQLPPEYKLWLEAAAMMHSVGKFMNYQGHHRHTQYIIANSELYGFTPEQRLIVSAIARYLGKSRPAPADRVYAADPRRAARICAPRRSAASDGGCAAPGSVQRKIRIQHARGSEAGDCFDCCRGGAGRTWSYGRCGRKPAISGKFLRGIFLSNWIEPLARRADRAAIAAWLTHVRN